MLQKGLSIIIPTFNRKDQLENQLKLIFKSRIDLIEEIVIIDNHSDYNISELVASFNSDKIRLIVQPFNIKVHNNIAFSFFHAQTEWFWLLSDDDKIEEDAIEKIIDEIERVPSNVAMIKFARTNSPQNNYIANNLKNFIDYYYNEKVIRKGDLVFISTNIYNIARLKKYLGYAFEYAYTYVPQIIPIIKGLEEENISIKFSNKNIVKYLSPREGNYSFAVVGKGLSTLSHIQLSLSDDYWRKFLNVTMSISYRLMISWSLKFESVNEIKIIYNNIYRYYIPLRGKLIVKMLIFMMSNRVTKNILLYTYNRLKNRRLTIH